MSRNAGRGRGQRFEARAKRGRVIKRGSSQRSPLHCLVASCLPRGSGPLSFFVNLRTVTVQARGRADGDDGWDVRRGREANEEREVVSAVRYIL